MVPYADTPPNHPAPRAAVRVAAALGFLATITFAALTVGLIMAAVLAIAVPAGVLIADR